MMGAWHQALKNVERTLMAEVNIFCEGSDPDGSGRCGGSHHMDDLLACPTKLEAIKSAKEDGWTWDSDGNWWCPDCSKEGE
tara:strand:- start:766 stop:1008 length:243 start_codon:yes stop_codon:yes gene_type:complete